MVYKKKNEWKNEWKIHFFKPDVWLNKDCKFNANNWIVFTYLGMGCVP